VRAGLPRLRAGRVPASRSSPGAGQRPHLSRRLQDMPALLDFAAPGQDQMDGFAQMQTDLNLINAVSATLGVEPGTNVAISVGNGATQTIDASTGNLVNGGRVFTVTSFSIAKGSTLNGSPTDQVNLNIGDVYFG